MVRINVYDYPTEEDARHGGQPTVTGWFDSDKATLIPEDTRWDGNNSVSVNTSSQWDHQALYRTAGGRWVLHEWSQWQGSTPTYRFVDEDTARTWLISNGRDAEIAEYFSALDEESGPNPGGRPSIGVGDPVPIRFHPDTLAAIDAAAQKDGISRAEKVRRLVDRLVHKAQPAPAEETIGFSQCQVCGQRVKRVPGGQGPTWIHSDSGAVAAPNPLK